MLLLDTHIWIRWQNTAKGNLALPQRLVELIETADRVAISAISCWELGQLVKRQRVVLNMPAADWVCAALQPDIEVLPIDRAVALQAAMLPEHHRDPADRMIIASALIYQASLMSLDSVFPLYQELQGVLER